MNEFKHDLSRYEIEKLEAMRRYETLQNAQKNNLEWHLRRMQKVKFERRVMVGATILVILIVWLLS